MPHPWVIFLALVLFYFVFLILSDIFHYRGLLERRNALREVVKEKAAAIVSLKDEIKFYNSNAGVEKVARQQLGMVRRGETSYKVIERRVEEKK